MYLHQSSHTEQASSGHALQIADGTTPSCVAFSGLMVVDSICIIAVDGHEPTSNFFSHPSGLLLSDNADISGQAGGICANRTDTDPRQDGLLTLEAPRGTQGHIEPYKFALSNVT